jgi:hypothetical protein
MNDEEMREIAKEEFDMLRGKEKKVSIVALKAWSNVLEMLEDRVITKEQLDEIVGDVADGKKQLDLCIHICMYLYIYLSYKYIFAHIYCDNEKIYIYEYLLI